MWEGRESFWLTSRRGGGFLIPHKSILKMGLREWPLPRIKAVVLHS